MKVYGRSEGCGKSFLLTAVSHLHALNRFLCDLMQGMKGPRNTKHCCRSRGGMTGNMAQAWGKKAERRIGPQRSKSLYWTLFVVPFSIYVRETCCRHGDIYGNAHVHGHMHIHFFK